MASRRRRVTLYSALTGDVCLLGVQLSFSFLLTPSDQFHDQTANCYVCARLFRTRCCTKSSLFRRPTFLETCICNYLKAAPTLLEPTPLWCGVNNNYPHIMAIQSSGNDSLSSEPFEPLFASTGGPWRHIITYQCNCRHTISMHFTHCTFLKLMFCFFFSLVTRAVSLLRGEIVLPNTCQLQRRFSLSCHSASPMLWLSRCCRDDNEFSRRTPRTNGSAGAECRSCRYLGDAHVPLPAYGGIKAGLKSSDLLSVWRGLTATAVIRQTEF